jgi:hypothetical protein
MPYLVQAAFWVGVIGTVAAAPLLCVLRFQRSYLSEPFFKVSAPVVLFFSAALTFAAIYELLPSSRWRTRIAGMIAGMVTFFGFAVWTTFMANTGRGPFDHLPGILHSFALVFVFVGWIPLGGGWIAGWVVSKLPDAPSEEAA